MTLTTDNCHGTSPDRMIASWHHRGLRRLYEAGNRAGVRADMVPKVERILQRLDAASRPEDMDVPGFRLHRLSGRLAGFWSVTVNANWRIIFRFVEGQAHDVDLVDYH